MTWFCVALGLTLFLAAAIGTAQEKALPDDMTKLQINPIPYPTTGKPQVVPLEGNSWDLYPRREPVSLRTFKQLVEEPGVLLSLRTDVKDFSHYLYTFQRDSLPAEPAQESRDGQIAVRFQKRNEAKSQLIATEIQAVSKSGERTKAYRVEIGYYPKELYAASGQTSQSWLVVQNTDLTLSGSSVDDWILDRPTAEDRAYAQKRWGDLVKGSKTDYEKAQALARAIMIALKPHGGIPSDRMLASSPFQQLEMAEAGKGGVACENYSAIFSWACNALDIPARRIGMNYPWSVVGDCNLEIAEGHNSTEIFDGQLNRWVWIDATFNILGVYMGDQGPIHMAELVQGLNDGDRVGGMTVVAFDPVTRTERRVSALESPQKAALFKYFKKDQQFRYFRK
ncbi:MAG: transglutaminase domain-containing protein [Candidatus Latescibacteria bacterium]|nr:transglutaminase domain-containing protein [Candidatus Latescibacterota bacterium]